MIYLRKSTRFFIQNYVLETNLLMFLIEPENSLIKAPPEAFGVTDQHKLICEPQKFSGVKSVFKFMRLISNVDSRLIEVGG